MIRTFSLMLLAAGAMSFSGCQSCSPRPAAVRTTVVPGTPAGPPPGSVYVPPPAPAPLGSPPPSSPPPGSPPLGGPPAVRVVPPSFPPGITPPPGPGPAVAPIPPGSSSQFSPRLEPNWLPAQGRADDPRLAQAGTDPLLGTPNNSPARVPGAPLLYPPEVVEKSTLEPPLLDEKRTPRPEPRVDEKRTSSFPAGIAQFVPEIPSVPGVSNGLRPSINDGLDWLAKNHTKTVLHLRGAGEPEGPDRTQVEKQGMTYVGLEVGPQSLTRERFETFAKLVGDVAARPLFVYDQDGSIAGPLWYLYFRKVSGDDDDRARIRAGRLGLRLDREGPYRQMWLAVQKYLEDNP